MAFQPNINFIFTLYVDHATQPQATQPKEVASLEAPSPQTTQPQTAPPQATQPQTTQPKITISEADRLHGVDHAEAAKAKALVAMALILALILITCFGYILIRRVIRQWRMQASLHDRVEKRTAVTDPWKVSAERMATPNEGAGSEQDPDEPDNEDEPHGH